MVVARDWCKFYVNTRIAFWKQPLLGQTKFLKIFEIWRKISLQFEKRYFCPMFVSCKEERIGDMSEFVEFLGGEAYGKNSICRVANISNKYFQQILAWTTFKNLALWGRLKSFFNKPSSIYNPYTKKVYNFVIYNLQTARWVEKCSRSPGFCHPENCCLPSLIYIHEFSP